MITQGCKHDVYRGDIIRWNDNYYIPEEGELLKNYYMVVSDMNSNNGTFKAKDHRGQRHTFNTFSDRFIVVKRANPFIPYY